MMDTDNFADFERDLCSLINKYSMENGSDTPDFILSEYLTNCLRSWNTCMQLRAGWRGDACIESIQTQTLENHPSQGITAQCSL